MPDKIKMSDLIEICRWNSRDSPSGTDYYILYSLSTLEDVVLLNIFGSMMQWEYDRWYQVSASDFPKELLEFFAKRPWNNEKQEIFNEIPKAEIRTPL